EEPAHAAPFAHFAAPARLVLPGGESVRQASEYHDRRPVSKDRRHIIPRGSSAGSRAPTGGPLVAEHRPFAADAGPPADDLTGRPNLRAGRRQASTRTQWR